MTRTIAITGATGFLGGALVPLALERGHRVRVIARASSDTGGLAESVDIRRCGIGPALAEHLDGVDVLIHAAGGSYARTTAELIANNADATRQACDAAIAAGVRRLVLVSSAAVPGPSATSTALAHDAPPRPRTAYGRAKAAAEEALSELPATVERAVLRLPGLYGPGDTRMLPVFRSAARGVLVAPAPHRAASLLHVDDAASAVLACAEQPHEGTWYAGPTAPLTPEDLARVLPAAIHGPNHRPARVVRAPMPLLFVIASLVEAWGRLSGRPVLLHRDKARELAGAWWLADAAPFEQTFGWRPRIPFVEGATATAADYRARGWL